MKLVNRVSIFFLAALALSLAGNGILLWGLVRHFLYQRFDQQLHAALHTLVAAIEVEDDDAKWEPSDHTIALGADDGLDDVRWAVFSQEGRMVDCSRNLSSVEPTELRLLSEVRHGEAFSQTATTVAGWHVLEQRLSAPHPKPPEEREPKEFAALRVLVARSPAEIQAGVRQLGLLLSGLSLAIWLFAAALGRWYCQRALQPVREMARHARDSTDADFRLRLPTGPHQDEVSDLSAAFNGLLDQLQQAFEKQRRFTGDAAHQLRTPLTVLLGQIDVALRRPRDAEEYQKTLGLLRTQTLELQEIIEALLYLARVEGDSAPPERESRDVATWLAEYVGRWDAHPRRSDFSVSAPDALALSTSWPLLAQLLDNLIGNAFKYSGPRTPVTLSVRGEDGRIEFAVADLGIGISREDHEAIFEPFFRSPAARQLGVAGTGLGLAISHAIARALGGRLTLDRRNEAGSCFRLALPQASDG